MAKSGWSILAQRYRGATLIGLDKYTSTLDAIDRALANTEKAVPAKDELSPFGWGDPPPDGLGTFKRIPRPITPVRTSDPTELLIGVLQRLVWNEREQHAQKSSEGPKRFYILLAMADKLSKRKLKLSVDQAVDLSMFCIFPGPTETFKFGRIDYMAPILRQIEREFPAGVPKKLKKRLTILNDQIDVYKADMIDRYRAFGSVPGTKHLEKFQKRLLALSA